LIVAARWYVRKLTLNGRAARIEGDDGVTICGQGV
jgi:hypothetical protein